MNQPVNDDARGFFEALIKDGRPLLTLTGLVLVLCGGFALFLSATGHFLPHDVQFLGMTADQLCGLHQCKVVHFMFHDRAAFGGSLIAIGTLYLWLSEFPLREGEVWAWWFFAVSGLTGFGSFLAYLGYGYLDTWHGVATLFLLPCFIAGLVLSHRGLPNPMDIRCLARPSVPINWNSASGLGRASLLVTSAGLVGAGLTIMIVGMTRVFVPQDLRFMGLEVAELRSINPHLVPLIAHDRAGFGGGLCTCGTLMWFCVYCGTPSRALWQAVCVSGSVGFITAIGVHPLIGYNDLSHLAPALVGSVMFVGGLTLSRKSIMGTVPIQIPACAR
jgi:hypothetical protein